MKVCNNSSTKVASEAGGIEGGRRSSSNCLSCYKPLVYEIDQVGDKVLLYSTEYVPRKQMKGESLDKEEEISQKVSRRRRSFSRIVKAFLFQIKLARSRNQKRSDNDRSFGKYDSKIGLVKSASKRSTQSVSSSSSSQSSTASSCLSSQISEPDTSMSSNSKPSKEKQNGVTKQSITMRLSSSFNSSSPIINGLIMLMISLCLTVFWGKLCAIALTSIWLYLMRGGLRSHPQPVTEKAHVEIVLEPKSEQKRRLIMKGLLERQHYHYHHYNHHQYQQQQKKANASKQH